MRIHFDNVNLNSTSGPNSFAVRLFVEFQRMGHTIVETGPDADVSLVFIEPSGKQLAKTVVQRLDGIWFKPQEFEPNNRMIKALYERADAVIWQSRFDKGMTLRWWGLPKMGNIIHNGIELHNVAPSVSEALAHVSNSHEKVFVCSANWHPQKRLRANLELFLHLRETKYPDSCCIVMGSNPDCYVPLPQILYTGPLSHKDCMSVFSIADWMIHLAWLDHCPNVVIEALSLSVPVIHSSSGGTRELVRQFGVMVDEKDEYHFDLADYDNPPTIDVKQVKSLPEKSALGSHIDLNITNVAKKYIELFETL